MAITFGGSALGTFTSGTINLPITITGAKTLLVVGVSEHASTGGTVAPNMTFNGSVLTRAAFGSNYDVEDSQNEIWYLQSPAPITGTILGTTTSADARVVATFWNGAAQTSVLGTTVVGSANSKPIAVAYVPTEGSCLVIDMNTNESNTAETIFAGQTNLRNIDEGTWQQSASYIIDSGAGTAGTMGWTNANVAEWTSVVAAFKSAPGTGIVFVKQAKGNLDTTLAGLGTALGTFATNPTAGNLIVVSVGMSVGTAGTVNSVTDTPGNTYTRIGGTNSTNRVDLYYAKNITGGTNIVKVIGSFTATAAMGFLASEYSGVGTVNAFDTSAFGTGLSSGLGTSGTTANTAGADELLLSAFSIESGTTGTIVGGWTNRGTVVFNSGVNNSVFAEDLIVSATGAYAGTASMTTLKTYSAGISSFQLGTTAPGTPPDIVGWKSLLGVGQG
jgi:hypothetical protein